MIKDWLIHGMGTASLCIDEIRIPVTSTTSHGSTLPLPFILTSFSSSYVIQIFSNISHWAKTLHKIRIGQLPTFILKGPGESQMSRKVLLSSDRKCCENAGNIGVSLKSCVNLSWLTCLGGALVCIAIDALELLPHEVVRLAVIWERHL